MALTNETVRELLEEYLGMDFDPADVERLRRMIEAQMERIRELDALDLGDDPRTMAYITDRRVQP